VTPLTLFPSPLVSYGSHSTLGNRDPHTSSRQARCPPQHGCASRLAAVDVARGGSNPRSRPPPLATIYHPQDHWPCPILHHTSIHYFVPPVVPRTQQIYILFSRFCSAGPTCGFGNQLLLHMSSDEGSRNDSQGPGYPRVPPRTTAYLRVPTGDFVDVSLGSWHLRTILVSHRRTCRR